ncbi:MAG: DUF2971 domain-containing protein [Desulfomonile tiedjei]|uniref:DUF2971 domain-containing protein n=1 Tax=Desulfomonile tiedjei TaxID=2358 RepID=A0A9D6V9V4_9BACT|nr:DUF2971 domain-containing protein [Desulfomonile tiedjei]
MSANPTSFQSQILTRSDYRHDQKCFFKYMPVETARIVLSNSTLRWSAPSCFKDPFDVVREIAHEVSNQDIQAAIVHRIVKLLENPPDDTSKLSSDLRKLIEAAGGRNPKESLVSLQAELLNEVALVAAKSTTLNDLRIMWRDVAKTMRILCLTTDPLNPFMWSHYADSQNDKGVVLKFNCDSLSSPWQEARAVTYTGESPDVCHADGWARLLSMPVSTALRRIFEISTLTKTLEWAGEKEWRVVTFKREDEAGDFSDIPFVASELSSIYLGDGIKPDDKDSIVEAAKAYPRIQIYEVKADLNRRYIISKL